MDGLKARLSFDAVAYDYDDEYLSIDTDTHTININNVSRLFGVQYDGNSKLIKFRIRNKLSDIQKMQDSIVYINWIDSKGVKGQSIAINKTINNDTCEFAWKVPFDALKNSGVLHFAMSAVMTKNSSSVIDQRWSTQIASVITPDGIYIKSYTPSSDEEDRIAQIYNELSNMINKQNDNLQLQINLLNKDLFNNNLTYVHKYCSSTFINASKTLPNIKSNIENANGHTIYCCGQNIVVDRKVETNPMYFELTPIEINDSYTLQVLDGDENITVEFFTQPNTERIEYWTATKTEKTAINKTGQTIRYARIARFGANNVIVGIKNVTKNITYEYSFSNNGKIKTYENKTMIFDFEGDKLKTYLPVNVINTISCGDLFICGQNATDEQVAYAKYLSELGCGYIVSENELDEGINNFIDKFINKPMNIYFCGTIRASHGIHKHPLHNLFGYGCTIKMGDNLGDDYYMCIFPTNGGIPFETKQVISHNHTVVKGFTLDGNCMNNKSGDRYVFKSVYGGVISHEIYNEDVSPYSKTQLVSDITLEDITAINTMRGIIVGIGWKASNLTIGDSMTDHALYMAGADNAIVENVYVSGFQKSGAISISGQSWDVQRKVSNIHLNNVTLDECEAENGAYLDIRGHFSSIGNNKGLDDVFIDGFYIKRLNENVETIVATIGTHSNGEVGDYKLRDYPINISIKNFSCEMYLYQSLFVVSNANLIMENANIILRNYRPDRPLFRLQSRNFINKALNFSGSRILFYTGGDKEETYCIFGCDSSSEKHNTLSGLNINNMVISGISNYNMFGLLDTSRNEFNINDFSCDKVVAHPVAAIKSGDEDKIKISTTEYFNIN